MKLFVLINVVMSKQRHEAEILKNSFLVLLICLIFHDSGNDSISITRDACHGNFNRITPANVEGENLESGFL